MKVCNENDLLINLYIDGELSDAEARALEAHMAQCPACRAYCDQLCMINRAICDAQAPGDLHSVIMGAVAAAQAEDEAGKVVDFEDITKKKKKKTIWKRLSTVAAMLAVAFVGLLGMGGFGGLGFAQKTESAADTNMAPMTESAAAAGSMMMSKVAESDTAAPEAEVKREAVSGAMPMQIEAPMLAWFNDSDADNVMAVQTSDMLPTEAAEAEGGAGQVMDEAQVQALADLLQDHEGYGFYLMASGRLIDLPAIFADQAGEDAAAGCVLVITVRSSDTVRLQIADNLQKAGFAVYDDIDGLYFEADASADEGLLIVDLTE